MRKIGLKRVPVVPSLGVLAHGSVLGAAKNERESFQLVIGASRQPCRPILSHS